MRRPSAYIHRSGELDVKMTPMIDVVFLLLIFFLWTASFQIVEQILPSRVSAASGTQTATTNDPPPPEEDFDDVVIRILWTDGQPAWRVNDQPVGSLQEVRGMLRAIARIRSDAPVILHPDGLVPLGHVIELYDAARLEGFREVQFAASESL
jgi:biopolymer transport protein ExbD